MAFTLSSAQTGLVAQQRSAPRASRRAAVRVFAQAEKATEIYIGKGKKITDDPRKYPDRVRSVGDARRWGQGLKCGGF